MFVIRRREDRKYVAREGSKSSYTRDFDNARRFSTREEAQRDCCGNEYIEKV